MRLNQIIRWGTAQFAIAIILLLVCAGCNKQDRQTVKPEFGKFYKDFQVEGCFLLFDPQEDVLYVYHPEWKDSLYTPASTFKICNSLIGLETGVIADEYFTLPWDSVPRRPAWDKNHTLKSAIENSVVWYYQELARRVGPTNMKKWLDSAQYGNKDTSGGIDKFWLTGGLRITPMQQLQFLKKLNNDALPFSRRNMDIVKSILVKDTVNGWIIRGKTGWGEQGNKNIGWYVGYIQSNKKAFYFVNLVSNKMDELSSDMFIQSRTAIVDSVFNHMKLLNAEN